jgi:hypothetical protein
VDEIPPRERDELREAFKPAAGLSRRADRVVRFAMLPAMVCLALVIAAPKSMVAWAMGGFAICVLAAFLVAVFSAALLRCPACRISLENGFGAYCPECGARALGPGRWRFGTPRCSACERDMASRKGGRRYRIRACTHCGVWLDDKGL